MSPGWQEADDPGSIEELFPLAPPSPGRRRATRGGSVAPPERSRPAADDHPRAEPGAQVDKDDPRDGHSGSLRSSWRHVALVGVGAAVAGLVARLAVVRMLSSHLLAGGSRHAVELSASAHLGVGWLVVGTLVVGTLVAVCARRGVHVLVCVTAAVAVSTIDLVAPVGIALVAAAVFATRRRGDVGGAKPA